MRQDAGELIFVFREAHQTARNVNAPARDGESIGFRNFDERDMERTRIASNGAVSFGCE